jgi:tight adherence protein C
VEVHLIQLLAFLSVFLFVTGLRLAFSPQSRDRPDPAVGEDTPALFRLFGTELRAVGKRVEPWIERVCPSFLTRLEQRLVYASIGGKVRAQDIIGLQVLLAALLGFGGALVFLSITLDLGISGLIGIVLAAAGWLLPALWLSGTATKRQERIFRALPFTIDLLTVSMDAGESFWAAVGLLAKEGPSGPLRDEFARMLREATYMGLGNTEALKRMGGRIQGQEFRSLIAAVIQSTKIGAGLVGTLKIQSEEIRRLRSHRAERKAARAPSVLILPVTVFILPAVFIVILVPLFLRAKGAL